MGLLDALGGQQPQASMQPIIVALLGLLASQATKGGGALGSIFGSSDSPGTQNPDSTQGQGQEQPGILGGLSSLLSSEQGGGALSSGLQGLLDRFRQSRYADKAESWISAGPNKPVAPQQLGEALGEDRIQWLIQQTGMSRNQLLSGLSAKLPEFVDKFTPNGRIPTEQEAKKLIH